MRAVTGGEGGALGSEQRAMKEWNKRDATARRA